MASSGRTPGGARRWLCRGTAGARTHCYTTTDPGARAIRKQDGSEQRRGKTPIFSRTLRPVQRYIITAAQNATPAHELFLKSLCKACDHLNAELLVVPIRYKNPTSRWSESQANDEVWAASVSPFLWNKRRALNKNLTLLGDIKTQPTASSPLTGFDAISGTSSGILGHTKMQLRTIATPQNKMAKVLTTTGVCTLPNYTDSKAGKLGEFHHSLSALIVEIQGGIFHLRQLHGDRVSGEFTDHQVRYTPNGAAIAPLPLALVMGDTHVDFIDAAVERATFGKGGMIETLRPRHLIWHDLLDGYSVNPHHYGNPFNAIAKRYTGKDHVRAEVMRAIEFVASRTPKGCESVIVPSNHDDFLRRWIIAQDWRTDPTNAEFYLETALAMVRGTRMGLGGTEFPNPFPYWVDKIKPPRVRCLAPGEPFVLANIALDLHGDRGPNGARGSIRNLRRIGLRSIVGHSHSPGIDEGCYQVGTSTRLSLEYLGGPSGWLNTHCWLHADGSRQLNNIVDGAWRLT